MTRCEKLTQKPEMKVLLGILHIADEEAYNHSLQVAEMVEECINLMQKKQSCPWTEEECNQIITGAMLLDLGKAYLPFGLQHNSCKLGIYERAIMDMHPILGCEAIRGDKESGDGDGMFGKIVNDIILMHHANADGTGYPVLNGKIFISNNQKETQMYQEEQVTIVPDYVWLVSYADRFIAMTRYRSYKAPLDYREAWEEIVKEITHHKLPHQYSNIFKKVVQHWSFFHIPD